ncbi:hypothetical protein CBS101457_002616 [Exobasidium rhododendri]|nr:hypothetical protein CBS101457_002616 [Exobasidium rhododendri]
MSFDDPSSFLFGLNQFATPSNHDSPLGGSSNNHSNNNHNNNQNNNNNNNNTNNNLLPANDHGHQDQRASALLTGLDPFTGNEATLEGGSFADHMELWTNVNFSFDGPTGHALLGHEDKEKDEGDKKDEDKEEDKRAGKKARNDAEKGAGPARRGKSRQREEGDDDHAAVGEPHEPPQHASKDAFNFQQSSYYPAAAASASSRNADDVRRSGFNQPGPYSELPRSTSVHDGRSAVNPSSPTPQGQAFLNGAQPGMANPNLPLGAFNGLQQHSFQGNASNGMAGVASPGLFNGQQQLSGQLDINSLLALQQIVAQNPLALASLGNFAGLNPQLGALSAQLSNLGALNGHNLQQLQQQMQQQQQQQQRQQHQPQPQSNGVVPVAAPHVSPTIQAQQMPYGPYNLGYQTGWPIYNNQFNQSPALGNLNGPYASLANGNLNRDTSGIPFPAGALDGDDDDKRGKDRRPTLATKGSHGKGVKPPTRERKLSSSDGNNSSGESGVDQSKMTSSERARFLEERAAERDDIPPLKLIDTGNPEADAEANRQAIEEDKRKRNTAASARFRVKKKQREAALEAHSKELSTQMSDLRDEVQKLRSENQWLKGLIQVRPGNKDGGIIPSLNDKMHSSVSGSEALQAAQQLQALQQAVTLSQQGSIPSGPGKQLERLRDTGIRPRGVGTSNHHGVAAAGSKRDREE